MKHHDTIQASLAPLVVTPTPYSGESTLGFILRTAAMNGYRSPNKMLRYAGMSENEIRSARPPLAKLARLYGRSADSLKSEGLDGAESGYNGRQIPLAGYAVHSMFTRCKHAGLCIECVREYGYIEAYQELKYAVACPRHGVKTLYHCPQCQQSLDWQRPGLTRCHCGADLMQVNLTKLIAPEVLALLGVLRAKLLNLPLDIATLLDLGFNIEGLHGMSLNTLLSVIYRFGLFNGKAEQSQEWDAVASTAHVLSQWPHRFHEYLANRHAPHANLSVSGLRGQFNSFYESFFKNIANNAEVQFLRDAFIQFGQQRWQKAIVDPKLSTTSSTGFGMQQLSTLLGVQPSTLRKLIKDGHVRVDTQILKATRKRLVLSPQQPFEFAAGLRLSLKQAAQRLDIPVNVLRAYRAQGLYQPKYLVVPIELFHERDVDNLHQDLMQGLTASKFQLESHHITLEAVMRMKVSAEVKALWLASVRKHQITAVASLSQLPSGLVFDQATVKLHMDEIVRALDGSISLKEVKDTLGLNTNNLFSLVKSGLLKTDYTETYGMRITGETVYALQQQHYAVSDFILTQQRNDFDWQQLEIPLLSYVQDKSLKITAETPSSKPKASISNNELYFSLVA